MKYLQDAILYNPFFLGLAIGKEEFMSELKKLGMPENYYEHNIENHWRMATTYLDSANGRPTVIVYIKDIAGLSDIEIYTNLVHEAVHVFQRIKNYFGGTDPGTEFEAYLIQNISYSLIQEYTRKTKGK